MSDFNLYFAGYEAIELTPDANILLSQYLDRKKIAKIIEYYKTHKKENLFLIDSGAFSAKNRSIKIDTDDYIDYINSISEWVDYFVSVDTIPLNADEVKKCCDATWENYLYMRERVNEKDKLIIVFHSGESFDDLKRILNYVDKDGSKIKYIGLSVGSGSPQDREQWFAKCFKVISESNNPEVMTHAFGMTSIALVERFPFTSSDSTTYVKAAAFGEICLKASKRYVVSSKKLTAQNHILNTSKEVQDYVDSEFRKLGTSLKAITEGTEERQHQYLCAFNVNQFIEWFNNYKRTLKQNNDNVYKEDLW